MATIKDIAKAAGVSQGTVSNVLNGKGNVSSEKIRLVEAASATLGYTINERAKLLRQGKSRIIAIILPNIKFRQYVDFYLSFTSSAESRNYSTLLFLSGDNPETERSMIMQARSGMARGIVAFPCSPKMREVCLEAGFEDPELLFVERAQDAECNYLGFDYRACGRSMAELALSRGLSEVTVVTGDLAFSNERDFLDAFSTALEPGQPGIAGTRLYHVRTDLLRRNQDVMQMFDSGCPKDIFVSGLGFAGTVRDVLVNFHDPGEARIHTVSPLFTMPEDSFVKYELNYRLMGKRAADLSIAHIAHRTARERVILENSGFREWAAPSPAPGTVAKRANAGSTLDHAPRINFLTLDSPETTAFKYLANLYTRSTGVRVNVSVSTYDEIHEILSGMDESSIYDVIRLDVTWLSWFAGRILAPLEDISPEAPALLGSLVDGLSRQYSHVGDRLYALPVSPSAQILYYRKDLFESTVLKRLYHEMYRERLAPPETFAEYNRIAGFFTRSLNPHSPVEFGTTVTLGSTGVAGTEFLTRYFARSRALFDDSGKILLDGPDALCALDDLVEARACSKSRYNQWWTHAAKEFSEGDVAMTILYSNFASELLNRDSRVVGRIGFAVVPGGSPVIGGGTLGVSRFSRNPELALSFIRWLRSEPVASASMLLGSVSANAKSYENYEIIDSYPWLELARKSFALSRNRRTPYQDFSPFDERRFLGILGLEVKNAYSGAISSAEALEKARSAYAKAFSAPGKAT